MSQFLRAPWTLLSTVAAVAVMLTACGKGQQAAPSAGATPATPAAAPVATVNGTPISREEYDVYLKALLRGKQPTEVTEEEKNQVLDQLVVLQLLSAQAVKD